MPHGDRPTGWTSPLFRNFILIFLSHVSSCNVANVATRVARMLRMLEQRKETWDMGIVGYLTEQPVSNDRNLPGTRQMAIE